MSSMETKLFAFAGPRRSGKGTAATALREALGGFEFNFADEVKRQAKRFVFETTGEIIDPWTDKSDRVRGLLQTLGTEVGRAWYTDLWVEYLVGDLERFFTAGARYNPRTRDLRQTGVPPDLRKAYVTDLRFPNEAAAIRKLGGIIIWVQCDEDVRQARILELDGPQAASRNTHSSEHSFGPEGADARLFSTTPQQLEASIAGLLAGLKQRAA